MKSTIIVVIGGFLFGGAGITTHMDFGFAGNLIRTLVLLIAIVFLIIGFRE